MTSEEREGIGVADGLRMTYEQLDFKDDLRNYQDCLECLKSYEKEKAFEVLQRMIHKYEPQINFWGRLKDGVYVEHNQPITLQTDEKIKGSLQYIGEHIPLYATIREGDKKLTEKLLSEMFALK